MTENTPKCFVNGEYIDQNKASISVFDMGFLFGASLYDVGYIYKNKLFDWNSHIDRVLKCSKLVDLDIPYSKKELYEYAEKLVNLNKPEYGLMYMQITFGAQIGMRSAKLLKIRPKNLKPGIVMFTVPFNTMQIKNPTEGVHCMTLPDRRWRNCHVKVTSLIANALAGSTAAKNEKYESILFDDEKDIVLEGSATNLFVVKDNVIYTHPLEKDPKDFGRILHGITRHHTINIINQCKVPLKEQEYNMEFLRNADEAFLTSTTKEVMPISTIDGKKIADGKPGKITLKLLQGYVDKVEKECEIQHPKRSLFY